MTPRSSQNTARSASPSKATPTSARLLGEASDRVRLRRSPSALMFIPLGRSPTTTTSAPSRRRASRSDVVGGAMRPIHRHTHPIQRRGRCSRGTPDSRPRPIGRSPTSPRHRPGLASVDDIRASITSSTSSGSFRPSWPSSLMPLSAPDCRLAETTTPRPKSPVCERDGGRRRHAQRHHIHAHRAQPAGKRRPSMGPLRRVSRPITARLRASVCEIASRARPRSSASSGVSPSLMPCTPSVPKWRRLRSLGDPYARRADHPRRGDTRARPRPPRCPPVLRRSPPCRPLRGRRDRTAARPPPPRHAPSLQHRPELLLHGADALHHRLGWHPSPRATVRSKLSATGRSAVTNFDRHLAHLRRLGLGSSGGKFWNSAIVRRRASLVWSRSSQPS